MKHSLLRPCALGLALLVGVVAVAPVAQAAKSKKRAGVLEIWPGQRVLIVLPITASAGFSASGSSASGGEGSAALAKALVPLVTPQLSAALVATGKFSITRPYKFDPLLRRALADTAVQPDEGSAFVDTPTLSNAQSVLAQFGLDQPGMVAQVVLQGLKVGGTAAMPTVQVTMSGDLYEAGSSQALRSITVTSKPFGGATPEERLRAASGEAFTDIANAFVEPPTEFQLPLPSGVAPGMMTGAKLSATMNPAMPMGNLPMQNPAGATGMPMTPPATPQMPTGSAATNAPVSPPLPGATAPGAKVPVQN